MTIHTTSFRHLDIETLYDILQLRSEVFVVEQIQVLDFPRLMIDILQYYLGHINRCNLINNGCYALNASYSTIFH
jgi:hypothetical protein